MAAAPRAPHEDCEEPHSVISVALLEEEPKLWLGGVAVDGVPKYRLLGRLNSTASTGPLADKCDLLDGKNDCDDSAGSLVAASPDSRADKYDLVRRSCDVE